MSVVPRGMVRAFKTAGWFEGRQIAVPSAVPASHPASALLAELGGLTLVNPAPNICSVAFQYTAEAAELMVAWEVALATKLVGIAVKDDGHAELYLGDRGHVIGCSLVHPACFLVGRTIEEALEAIGSGKRAQPMLLSDEEEITLYGETYRQGDQAVIGPSDLA